MTTQQRIQWVTVPGGATADGGRLVSVFVAPRLRSDEGDTLAAYPDFVSWPDTLSGITWQVSAGGVDVPCAPAGDAAEPAFWTALFPPGTAVTPYRFDDYADLPMVSYDAGAVLDTLRAVYTRVAAAAADDLPRRYSIPGIEPPVRGLADLLGELREVVGGELFHGADPAGRQQMVAARLAAARDEARRRRTLGPRGNPLPVDPWPGRPQVERALLFHSRPDPEPRPMPAGGEHYRQQVDFHQMISSLGDHPELLRRLGLIVDLRVEAADLPDSAPLAPATIRATPTLPPDAAELTRVNLVHETAYVSQDVPGIGPVFVAAQRTPDPLAPAGSVPTGLQDLPESAFRLEQVDIDGATLKAVNLAATIFQPVSPQAGEPLHQPDAAGLPALRTSGLMLVRTGRAAALQSDFAATLATNDAVERGDPVTLYAEDLVRGHRLDVLDTTTGRWRSLHARVESVTASRYAGEIAPVPGEGFLQLSLAGPLTPPGTPPDPHAEVYVHETVATWDGWSLSVPRPGASLSRDPRAPDPDVPETQPTRVTNDPQTTMDLSLASDVVPGTLPRLRFGRGYRVRMRTVNLVGDGPTLQDADRWLALPAAPTPVLPAAAATVYRRFEPLPAPAVVPAQPFGEGASLLRLVIRSNGDDPDAWAAGFNAEHEAGGPNPHPAYAGHDDRHLAPPKASFELAERHGVFDAVIGADGQPDAARLAAIADAYQVARREKGSFDDPDVPGAELVPIPHPPAAAGEPDRSDQWYVVHGEEQLELPYLPDPLCGGAVFFGLPGAAAGPTVLAFDGPAWHGARPLRLRLADGAGAPAWDPDARLLTVQLGPSHQASIRVMSQLTDLDLMGMLDWCGRSLHGEDLDRVLTAMKENRSWLTTPWHEIDLVHAVQQPLAPPVVDRFAVSRSPGDTAADLSAELRLHVGSTEKIDVLAEWTDAVDDPPAAPRPAVAQATAVFDLACATAATISDYAPVDQPYALVHGELLLFNTAIARSRGLPSPAAHQFGDTRYRRVAYTVQATTAFREYFPAEWAGMPGTLTRSSEVQVLDVPCSAPPATPDLLYAVPTLSWEDLSTEDSVVRRRRGGGVRLWLERGWWSSGAGERLGVVFGPSVVGLNDPNHQVTSFIGQDPIRAGGTVAAPTRSTFTGPAEFVDRVTLLEGHAGMSLATFEPEFDPSSKRWFCDIDLDTGDAYLPVLRLALVRYQPHALSGCAVSRVVLVDLVQSLPDRMLTVTREPGADGMRTVSVAGPSYTASAGTGDSRSDPAVLAVVRCQVQRRPAGAGDSPLAWVDVPDAAVELPPALAGGRATWTGPVPVPEPPPGSDQQLLVVEEERLAVDEQTPSNGGFLPRVVFAATVAL
jgi:hypothetical protein